jgi:hypothetical protein
MDTLKKCNARNRLSAGRNKSQHSFRTAGQPDRADSSKIEHNVTRPATVTFAEDFMLEHSHPGRRIALMGMADSYEAASREPQESTQSFGFPS